MNAILPLLSGFAQGTQQREQRNYDRGLQQQEIDRRELESFMNDMHELRKTGIPFTQAQGVLQSRYAKTPQYLKMVQDGSIAQYFQETPEEAAAKKRKILSDEADTKYRNAQAESLSAKPETEGDLLAKKMFSEGKIDLPTFHRFTNNKYANAPVGLGGITQGKIENLGANTNLTNTKSDATKAGVTLDYAKATQSGAISPLVKNSVVPGLSGSQVDLLSLGGAFGGLAPKGEADIARTKATTGLTEQQTQTLKDKPAADAKKATRAQYYKDRTAVSKGEMDPGTFKKLYPGVDVPKLSPLSDIGMKKMQVAISKAEHDMIMSQKRYNLSASKAAREGAKGATMAQYNTQYDNISGRANALFSSLNDKDTPAADKPRLLAEYNAAKKAMDALQKKMGSITGISIPPAVIPPKRFKPGGPAEQKIQSYLKRNPNATKEQVKQHLTSGGFLGIGKMSVEPEALDAAYKKFKSSAPKSSPKSTGKKTINVNGKNVTVTER